MSQKVLDILLQKNDSRIAWGFSLCAGPDSSILIDKVWPGALACQYLTPGDRLLSMDGVDCRSLSVTEASQIAVRPANALNLIVAKASDKMQRHQSTAPKATRPVHLSSPVAQNAGGLGLPLAHNTGGLGSSVTHNTNGLAPPSAHNTSVLGSPVAPKTGAMVDNSQEAWRRRCRQSTSPSSSARRSKAAFWERCTSPQRQPVHPPSEFRSSRSVSSGRSTPTRYWSDGDAGWCAGSERDWDSSSRSVASDSGRGHTSYGRQVSCPAWVDHSNDTTHQSRTDSSSTTNSANLQSTAAGNPSNLQDKNTGCFSSYGTNSIRVYGDTECLSSKETNSNRVYTESKSKTEEEKDLKSFDDIRSNSQQDKNTKYLSSSKETNANRVHTESKSKTEEEEDLKWFSSQEIKYGYVDSEARTHFVEDSKWPVSCDRRFEVMDDVSKTQNVHSTLKCGDVKQFSSPPSNFERHEFSKHFNSTRKETSDKKESSEVSSTKLEDFSSEMCARKEDFERHKFSKSFDSIENRKEASDKKVSSEVSSTKLEDYTSRKEESQESYHRESKSRQSYNNRSVFSTSQKCLESEFEKSFELFANMMQTGDECLFKQAKKFVSTDEGKQSEFEKSFEQFASMMQTGDECLFKQGKEFVSDEGKMSENFRETERRFESYVKDLNASDNTNVDKKFEKTVLEKSEELCVTRSHTPAGFYDNHSEASTVGSTTEMGVEGKRRPASECLGSQDVSAAFNQLPSDTLQADSRRQQSQISGGGNSPSATAYHESTVPTPPPPPPPMMSQGGVPPPPPPPPPLGLVHIPNMRLKTEIADVRREPPAAIQNAMMTKDKKPFTYTPGGLDLSEIRSPRMARRINRNAHAEDAAAGEPQPRPAAQPRPLSMPPQMAVPVFPPQPPPPPPPAPPQSAPSPQPPQPLAVPKLQPVQRQAAPSPVSQNTGSIYVPPVQHQPSQPTRSQLGSLYVPPVQQDAQHDAQNDVRQVNKSPAPWMTRNSASHNDAQHDAQNDVQQVNKSPAPWMTRNSAPQQQQQQPPWVVVNREPPQSPVSPVAVSSPPPSYGPPHNQAQTRIIPIQIEGRETPQPSNTRIIPIQLEASPSPSPQYNPHAPQFNYQQQQQHQQPQQQFQQRRPVYVHNKNNPQYANANENSAVDGRSQPQGWANQEDSGAPVQSRSFRVLQKVTDAYSPAEDMPYNSQGVPLSQLRKLQLSDDDRALMNKVKTQVDEEQFLHNESDPRYRGASIPSRAFRMLQNMTEHPGDYMAQVPQGSGSPHVLTNRRPQPQEPTPPPSQPYIPPSEQQVEEPRKYLGGAIPSRSFKILQAMTAGSNPSGTETHEHWSEQVNNVEGEPTSYPAPYPCYEDPNNYYNGYYYDLNQPPQTPEEQQQFWEHYNAMCAYMAEMNAAAYRYSPYPHAYPPVPPPPHPLSTHYFSDSDGYSSTDEMAYYGAYFQRRPPPAPLPNYRMFRGRSATPTPAPPRIVITPTEHSSSKSDTEAECGKPQAPNIVNTVPNNSADLEHSSSGSDTEVDDDNDDEARVTGLKTIRSVPDINIYKDSTGSDISSSIPRSDSGSVKEEDDEDEDEDEDDDEVEEEVQDEDDSSLHQLSVIYEESEHSSLSHRDSVVSEDEDASSATLDNCDDEDTDDDDDDDDDGEGIPDSDTVTVRLPLKLKFSKANGDRDMATVIVGKSEVQPTSDSQKPKDSTPTTEETEKVAVESCIDKQEQLQEIHKSSIVKQEQLQEIDDDEEADNVVTSEEEDNVVEVEPEGMIVEEITRDDFDADVSVTISLKKFKPKPQIEPEHSGEKVVGETSSARGSSPVDFWKTIISEDESVSGNEVTARGSISSATEEDEPRDGHWEDDSSSTSVQTVRKTGTSGSDIDDSDDNFNNSSCRKEPENVAVVVNDEDEDGSEEEEESSESSESSSDSDSDSVEGDEEDEVEERDVWNKDSHVMKQFEKSCDKMNHLKVDSNSKVISRDDESEEEEEEDDSGVTSDMSRHISETDTDPECSVGRSSRKMNSYQRAATHSRLFKLLQEECAQEDDVEAAKVCEELPMSRKDKLTLSLNEQLQNRERDSLSSSSGVDSPSSPNNFDQLANELVQSLLKRKKGRHFRKLPLAKLHDAAVRILTEDAGRCCDAMISSPSTDESNIYSPVHIPGGSIYGDNYHNYCDYYSTWGYPDSLNDSLGSDIVPSKTFKMLQEHTTAGGQNVQHQHETRRHTKECRPDESEY